MFPLSLFPLVALLAVTSGTLFFADARTDDGAPGGYDLQNAVVLIGTVFDPQRITVSGTGFIVHSIGLILTNAHLVSGRVIAENRLVEANRVNYRVWLRAGTPQERELPAFLVSISEKEGLDLALLQLPAENAPYPFLKFGRSADAQEGRVVRALGFPLGSYFDAVTGVRPALQSVSGLIQKIHKDDDGKPFLIEHTAPLVQGFSGGPLLDESGAVIGVNTWAVKQSPGRVAIAGDLAADWISGQGFSLNTSATKGVRPLADRLDWINLSPVSEAPHKRWCTTTQNFLTPAVHENGDITVLVSRNFLSNTPPQVARFADDGTVQWTRVLPDDPTSAPVLVPGTGVSFVIQNILYLYNDAGEKVWEILLPRPPEEDPAYRGKTRRSRPYRWLAPVVLSEGIIVVGGDAPEVLGITLEGDPAWRVPIGPVAALLPVHDGVAVFLRPTRFIGSPGEAAFLNGEGVELGRIRAGDLSKVPGAQFILPAVSEPGGDLYARVTHTVLARITSPGFSRWSRSDLEMWQPGELGSADAPTRMALIGSGGKTLLVLNKINGGTLALIPAGASSSWIRAGWIGDDTLVAVRALSVEQGTLAILTVFRVKDGAWQPVVQWRAGPGPGIAIPDFYALKTALGNRIFAVVREGGESRLCALVPPPL